MAQFVCERCMRDVHGRRTTRIKIRGPKKGQSKIFRGSWCKECTAFLKKFWAY